MREEQKDLGQNDMKLSGVFGDVIEKATTSV